MQVGQRQVLQKGPCGVVLLVGFTGEADHHVGAESASGDPLGDLVQAVAVLGTRVTSAHAPQDAVVATLQRNVQVTTEACRTGGVVDEFVGDVARFDRIEADALEAVDVLQPAQQVDEGTALLAVVTVAA